MQVNGNIQEGRSNVLMNKLQEGLESNYLKIEDLEVFLQSKKEEVGDLQQFLINEFQEIQNAKRSGRAIKRIINEDISAFITEVKVIYSEWKQALPLILTQMQDKVKQYHNLVKQLFVLKQQQILIKDKIIKQKNEQISKLKQRQTNIAVGAYLKRKDTSNENLNLSQMRTSRLYKQSLQENRNKQLRHSRTLANHFREENVNVHKNRERNHKQTEAYRRDKRQNSNLPFQDKQNQRQKLRRSSRDQVVYQINDNYCPSSFTQSKLNFNNQMSPAQKFLKSSSKLNVTPNITYQINPVNRHLAAQFPKNQIQYYAISPNSRQVEKKHSVKRMGEQVKKNLQSTFQRLNKMQNCLQFKVQAEQVQSKNNQKNQMRRQNIKKKIQKLRHRQNNV